MSFFINPGALPGGREWASACAAARAAPDKAAETLVDGLACDSSAFSGLIQVLTLLAVYGFVLYTASGLIAEGSELLLLVPSLRGIVGSIVLPVLGAVPDGCIVFFSGLGPNAQEEITVGVGALAGSTSMLLTVPWFLSVLAGRVNIRPDGTANYSRPHSRGRWAKLMPAANMSLDGTGVEPHGMVAISGKIMGVTAISYVIIQIAALSTGNMFVADQTKSTIAAAARAEKLPAGFCFLVSMAFFAWYLYYQLTTSSEEEVEYRESRTDAVRAKAIQAGSISLSAAFQNIWSAADEADESTGLVVEEHKKHRLSSLLRVFFNHYDVDRDNTISSMELNSLMMDLGEHLTQAELQNLVTEMDTNNSGHIDFDEFVAAMPAYIRSAGNKGGAPANGSGDASASQPLVDEGGNGEGDADGEEEEEEVPHDLRDDDPKAQIRNVMRRSFSMMALGTALVLIFSDPMVDVLGDVGARIGVPAFYISFILAPLASNASELFAAYQYAMKKTRKTVTISFSTLLGAAILNNTFVLAIFMALIYMKGLAWNFTAETISILFVECVMLYFSQKRIQTLRDGYMVLSLFPISLLIVIFLENFVGLD